MTQPDTQKPIDQGHRKAHQPSNGGQGNGGSDKGSGSGNPPKGNGNGGGDKPPTPRQQSAFDLMRQTLRAWGLGSLIPKAIGFLKQGLSSAEVQLKLENTQEWKVRFAGNELRKANGLAELTPAEYMATEASYRQVLSSYGLPEGFYNQHSDFNKWIGGDVSPQEIQSRADIAKNQFEDADPAIKAYWQKLGLKPGDAIAAILDPGHESLADLQRTANAAALGGAGSEFGLTLGTKRAYQLADRNVTLDNARAAYQQIAQYGAVDQQIAQRYGTTFGQNAELDSLLLGTPGASRKRNLIYSEESAQFGSGGGASSGAADVGANY